MLVDQLTRLYGKTSIVRTMACIVEFKDVKSLKKVKNIVDTMT